MLPASCFISLFMRVLVCHLNTVVNSVVNSAAKKVAGAALGAATKMAWNRLSWPACAALTGAGFAVTAGRRINSIRHKLMGGSKHGRRSMATQAAGGSSTATAGQRRPRAQAAAPTAINEAPLALLHCER